MMKVAFVNFNLSGKLFLAEVFFALGPGLL